MGLEFIDLSNLITTASKLALKMDDDDAISILSPSELEEESTFLQTLRQSLPYDCEPVEEMWAKLEFIVGKIAICVKSKNWTSLTSWDDLFSCWLLMRHPMPKSIRSKLVRLYYELCNMPGIELRLLRHWADKLTRLLINKSSSKFWLEASDLQLPWLPLWHTMQKYLWQPKRGQDSSVKTFINLFLSIASTCRRYFDVNEIPLMLETFYPLVTQESILVMIPVITSFLPPSHTHLFVPSLFKIWEAFNSSVVDERLLELAGELSEEQVSAKSGDLGGSEWKDVGIWSETQWKLIVGKGLGSMDVPVGNTRGINTTANHADAAIRLSFRTKNKIDKHSALARALVYSMALDGPFRDGTVAPGGESLALDQETGFLEGSRALYTLERLTTSLESFFHPSNSGAWTSNLSTFLVHLTAQFCKRWNEERLPTCKTPAMRRLTSSMRQAFVKVLRTPALMATFAKDPASAVHAHVSLRFLASLESAIIMPEILARAYSGLEVVNETHRTTAVLSLLNTVAHPLVSEKSWLGGQKYVLELLELSLPGLDLNDPAKTVCSTTFIVAVVQHIKIGDLTVQPSSSTTFDDMSVMESPQADYQLPAGIETGYASVLSKEEERALTRDSTARFADWVVSLFRRVLAVYENLPEEGGHKQTTGGKQEETVVKFIKSMLEIVCLHLSDQLFDLILQLVYDYATTNARSNAVRVIGHLVGSLARAKPEKVIKKFLPHCASKIEEELNHGASSVRTTGNHATVPSDTTLHWNISILHGCLGHGGSALQAVRNQVIDLLKLLIDKTKSERGFSLTGRLLMAIVYSLAASYPINDRFVNSTEWDDASFDRNHHTHWGKKYKAEDIKIEWHKPSSDEIDFVMAILENVHGPLLDKIEKLLESAGNWDSVARNDFCRFLTAVRSMWNGLHVFFQERNKEVVNPRLNDDFELAELLPSCLDVKSSFVLTDPQDSRYQKFQKIKERYGTVVHRAASALRQNEGGESHVDAILGVVKAIDSYLLEYGMTGESFDAIQRNYVRVKSFQILWPGQQESSRLFFMKRARLYNSCRTHVQTLFRHRSALDDKLLIELAELSLSHYTRVRRHAQKVLQSACDHYLGAINVVLPSIFKALSPGNDPDRMKGALYVLGNKSLMAQALGDQGLHNHYPTFLLECQHEEKPSVQKLVNDVVKDSLAYLNEEATSAYAYIGGTARVEDALNGLLSEFPSIAIDQGLLASAMAQYHGRVSRRIERHNQMESWTTCFYCLIQSILDIALRPTTHVSDWKYIEMATSFLCELLRRDLPLSNDVAKFLMDLTISPQPNIRTNAQRAVIKLLKVVKIQTYSQTFEEMWLENWQCPLSTYQSIKDISAFFRSLDQPLKGSEYPFFVDKLGTGFLAWTPTIRCYRPVAEDESPLSWNSDLFPILETIASAITSEDYFDKLTLLWSQEGKTDGNIYLRTENVTFIKMLAKMLEHRCQPAILAAIDPLLVESDRTKQRAGAELFAGLLRGSKHWTMKRTESLWSWAFERFHKIFSNIKPDTLTLWEEFFFQQLLRRDPRRIQILVDWMFTLPLDFKTNSAFDLIKATSVFGVLLDSLRMRFRPAVDKYFDLFLDNADTGYAEVRSYLGSNLYMFMRNEWQPSYPSTSSFLVACEESNDPLYIRKATYPNRALKVVKMLQQWKEERLPPPRVNQSQYDKVGLTLLTWVWTTMYSPQAPSCFPLAVLMLPEMLRMLELNDNPNLQMSASAVLLVLSAVTPPQEYVQTILDTYLREVKSSKSWRIRLQGLPLLVVFFYRNLLSIPSSGVSRIMEVLFDCLGDENVEVRMMASKSLSGIIRCSQRQMIIPMKDRFVATIRKTTLPPRKDGKYAESLRTLHSAVLGVCALIESFPYSVEPWMPALTEVLAAHITDPPPISSTIRKCASEFKKTHQDTWHKDQEAFDEEQLQNLSTMLVGTSYYA